MFVRLAIVSVLVAVFALSFSVLVDGAHQRSVASPMMQTKDGCLADGLLCARDGELRG